MVVPTISIGSPLDIVKGSTGGNVTAIQQDGISGIVTFQADVATAATDATTGAIWTIDTGLTALNVNGINASGSMTQRYVALDMSDLCQADTIGIAGQSGATNKGVISYGTADVANDAATDLTCRVLHSATPQVADTTQTTGFITFMAFGPEDNHGKYRIEVEESDDNTGVFEGAVEFIMLNQNTIDTNQATTLDVVSDGVTMLMTADLTGTDAPRIKYNDTDSEGIYTGIADQVDAPTHSGTVSFDSESYKVADTVTITVTDQDLNTDSELIDVYITQADDKVGDNDTDENHVLDVYFGDVEFNDACETVQAGLGLYDTGFQLV
jgi:hypothetical protein